MTSKQWCISFLISVGIIVLGYVLLNVLVDPFGVFGDPILDWYSYNMTNNPRVAKIGYLDKNETGKTYDSYIIGCSSTSSFPAEDLDHYLGGHFYNMIMYGADMLDVEQTCQYVIQEYGAKRIVINIFLSNATKYDVEEDRITKNMHAKLNGESPFSFYTRYLFLTPQYAIAKLEDKAKDTYATQPFDVFDVSTGAYDKKVRDVEPIQDIPHYLEMYPIFADYPAQTWQMTEIDTTVASIQRIKTMCEQAKVDVTFVMAPAYSEYVKYFPEEQVKEFHRKIAEVTDYWDFTTSSLTNDPRFFYDESHFRNSLGKMVLAKMVGATDTYYPEDIGEYVTKDTVEEHINKLWQWDKENEAYTTELPILTYHSVVENPSSNSEISPKQLEQQLQTLQQAGYITVSWEEVLAYVKEGKDLPEKPVMITFDDGYRNNYEIAFPLLQKYQMKATIFVIGISVGSVSNYKDTNYPITPHFTYEEAKEMIDSGLISIQTHTYDMHQWTPYETAKATNEIRETIVPLEGESETDYRKALQADIQKAKTEIQSHLGSDVVALAYPSGKWETITNIVLKEEGIQATVTIEEGVNEIIKGLPQSLYALKRFNMDETVTTEKLLEMLSPKV